VAIIPIILSGGSGTRLWPLSRQARPKQFLNLVGDYNLLQQTLFRCQGDGFDPRAIIVANEDHRFLVAQSLAEIGCKADILLEPAARNSCPAIIAGCLQAISRDEDAMVLVLAADHLIRDVAGFQSTVMHAANHVPNGALVTFGIKPAGPATGYGYVMPGEPLVGSELKHASRFVEKPDARTAENYVREGYLWNSGNFLFSAHAFLREIEAHQPLMLQAVSKAMGQVEADLDFLRLGERAFCESPSISVDYALMEHTQNALVMPADHDWSDMGNWDALWQEREKDDAGNAVTGDVLLQSASDNFVYSPNKLTCLHGVNDMVVVNVRDCLFIAPRHGAHNVAHLLKTLKEQDRSEASQSAEVYRPWGRYESIDTGEGYQVKRIVVPPGGRLSLQRHRHRAEHWIVVRGQAEVTIGQRVSNVETNQSVYVPLGEIHRLANVGDEDMVLIEVQTGDYLGEDDIERLDDIYNRD